MIMQLARILGISTLTTSLATQYTVPVGATTRITRISISAGSTANGVTIQIKDSSLDITKNLWNGRSLAANTTAEIFDLILEAGDQILAKTTTATDFDIIIMGIEDV